MKIIISLCLFVIIALSLPVMLSSDAKVILRAIHKTDGVSFETLLMPSWVADLKLKTFAIRDCNLVFSTNSNTGPVINFLVAAYGGKEVNNLRVAAYITQFAKQGCDVNAYDQAGMTSLHAAVLFERPQLVKLLLDNKADMRKKIQRSGKRVDGMQPLEFAKFLSTTNNHQALSDIINILRNKR